MSDKDLPAGMGPPAANATPSDGIAKPKRRSLSFGNGLKPKHSGSTDGNKSDSGSATGIGSGRVRGFFASLGNKKKQSANSLSSSDAPTSSSEGGKAKVEDAPPAVKTGPPPSRSESSLRLATIPQGGSEIMERSISSRTERGSQVADPFRQAVINAESAVDKLQSAYTILSSIAQLASVAQELLPGVGAAVGVVANMVKSAKTVAVNKVTALRLVERCATILLAVQQAMIDTKGQVTPAMRINVERLLNNLHGIAELLSRIAAKAFFEQYFKADEYARQILKAGEDLSDFVQIFELQTQIDVGAWRQQLVEDREKDVAILTGRLQDILDRGGDIIRVMEIQSEQQQEAIAALQRRVDQIASMQIEELHQHHPDSPSLRFLASLPPIQSGASTILPTRDAPDSGLGLNIATKPQPQVDTEAEAQIPAPKPAELQRQFSTGHRQFEEKALEALRRVSGDTQGAVPDWVITFLEVSREERIKTGFFSEVWKGVWQDRTVAIKLLSPTADKALFIKEVEVWRRLRSPYILPFLGASSTTGPPPWMLISPYMRNGNIIDYLQTPKGKRCDKFAMIHQIALGMDYLLSRDILHGDLKANNILVNDAGDIHICDFGLSQLKTDIKRKSIPTTTDSIAQGALRWQSPERLKGGRLTWRCDVYSFAMVIYEIFSDGAVPFGQVDDKIFRRDITKGLRPPRPDNMPEKLWLLTARCWAQDPKLRPKFSAISKEIAEMYTPRDTLRQGSTQTASSESTDNETAWATASEGESEEDQQLISPTPHLLPLAESSEEDSSSASSLRSIPPHLEHEPSNESNRAEKHYRHYLSHDFDDRLSIALWFPSPVPLGSVGYIRHGQFVKLLDAHSPPTGLITMPPAPYLDEFSSLQITSTPINVRSGLEKNLDRFVAWTKFTKSSGETAQKPIVRHLDFPLKPGRRQAALVVGDAHCEIYQSFDEARCYLTDNIGWILDNYGETHHVGREDIMIIVGTLTAQHYAMIISDFSPRTTLKFNVHAESARGPGEPWGTWSFVKQTTDTAATFRNGTESGANSPISPKGSFVEPLPRPAVDERRVQYTCKVSNVSGSPRDAVLLAKLKFAPGETDPTLYP